ncbi:hypothetical protein RFI_14757 [Reticulomyxa filosa]|uniref:CAF1B/HIR1 beta-propeller domain-containing protein n=1 Tax=Reticulomyxa filosa TaxID=46433 RepID=X6N843_RETFI|nr:hypothetical protein RFI_14757 [Reticulomyxa filosa]|eukprot:ETO22440.1 hypothetical protein RFI_14757 [Reticulomyxa filosa]
MKMLKFSEALFCYKNCQGFEWNHFDKMLLQKNLVAKRPVLEKNKRKDMPNIVIYNVCTHSTEDLNSVARPTPALVSCHPTKKMCMATAGGDFHVSVWDMCDTTMYKSGLHQLVSLKGHTCMINSIDWYKGNKSESTDGKPADYLASGGDDGKLIIWDVTNEKQLKQKRFEKEELSDVLWVNSSDELIVSTVCGGIYILSAFPDITLLQTMSLSKTFIQGVSFDMHNFLVVQTANSCRVIKKKIEKEEKTSDKVRFESKNPGNALTLFPTSKQHLFAGNVATLRRKPCFSPDGMYLCASGGQIRFDDNIWGAVHLFHRSNFSKKVSSYVIREDNRVRVCKFSPRTYPCDKENTDKDSLNSKYGMTYSMRFAAITRSSVYVFDTSQSHPLLYWRDKDARDFFDVDWNCDGSILLVTDSEGFITAIRF